MRRPRSRQPCRRRPTPTALLAPPRPTPVRCWMCPAVRWSGRRAGSCSSGGGSMTRRSPRPSTSRGKEEEQNENDGRGIFLIAEIRVLSHAITGYCCWNLNNPEKCSSIPRVVVNFHFPTTSIENRFKFRSPHPSCRCRRRCRTSEEQRRLEELLVKFPSEDVEMERWKKVAAALGNRTAVQGRKEGEQTTIRHSMGGRLIHTMPHFEPKFGPFSTKHWSRFFTLTFQNSRSTIFYPKKLLVCA